MIWIFRTMIRDEDLDLKEKMLFYLGPFGSVYSLMSLFLFLHYNCILGKNQQ